MTCRFCAATIRPPGGRAEGVTHCPWCSKDLRPAAPTPPAPPPVPPRPPRRLPESLFAAAVLAGSAGAAVAAFFAARWLAAALG